MTPLKQRVNCLMLVGCLVWPNVVRTAHFDGDTSLSSYLTILCSQLHPHSKVQLALVVEGNRSQANSPLARHLRQLSCGHLHPLDQNNTSHDPWRDVRWLHSHWLLLFDWSHLTRWTLTGPMMAASHLYTRCGLCLPPIGLLDPSRWSVAQLADWSRQILPRLDSHFRMVLVAGLDRVDAALHIRPVLDGCHLLDSVLLPKTTDDYRRLRVPPHRCNLNGTTLNVAANNVYGFCLLQKTLIHYFTVSTLLPLG